MPGSCLISAGPDAEGTESHPAGALPSAAVMSELQGCFQTESISEVFNLCTLIVTRVLASCLRQAEPVASSAARFPSTGPRIISAP